MQTDTTVEARPRTLLRDIVGPGILVAATGVGSGDLVTAAFTGHRLGASIVWAVVVGAALKLVLSEGLARYQLASGRTLLEGVSHRFGRVVQSAFLVYLLFWSFFVGAALMGACGVTANAVTGLFDDPATGKIVFGLLHSAVGVVLVRRGGYELFEKVMKVFIGVMFTIVVITGVLVLVEDWSAIAASLAAPEQSPFGGEGLRWTVALIGGVGGTVTLLSYGYWMREEGRTTVASLRACRIDLAVGYLMTALFGLAMVVIGSTIDVEGDGTGLIVALAGQLETRLGPAGRWVFLLGAWGTVTCSLLGVWQSVPYIFADLWALIRERAGRPIGDVVDVRSRPYRGYLIALAIVPAAGLFWKFDAIQQLYAIVGAAFMPLLAAALLALNGRRLADGERRNGPATIAALVVVLAFFVLAGAFEIWG